MLDVIALALAKGLFRTQHGPGRIPHRTTHRTQDTRLDIFLPLGADVAPDVFGPRLGVIQHRANDVGDDLVGGFLHRFSTHVAQHANPFETELTSGRVHHALQVLGKLCPECRARITAQVLNGFLDGLHALTGEGLVLEILDEPSAHRAVTHPERLAHTGGDTVHDAGGDERAESI